MFYAGLTGREATVLDTLIRLGGAWRELLVLPAGELEPALERLVALAYVTAADGQTVRAVAQ